MKGGVEGKVLLAAGCTPFFVADSQRLMLLLRGERMSVDMSLVWLTMSKALERSFAMVDITEWSTGLIETLGYITVSIDTVTKKRPALYHPIKNKCKNAKSPMGNEWLNRIPARLDTLP